MQEKTRDGASIIVVGGGGAGLCAAIAAADGGASHVLLLEKMPRLGGDTIISGQVISAAGTDLQAQAGIEDSPQHYLTDLIAGGRYRNDMHLAVTLVENGATAWKWLEEQGCSFTGSEGLHIQHDHTAARSVKFAPPGMIGPLKQAAEARGVEILLETPATRLLVEEGRVVGVAALQDGEPVTFRADSVILASGGFGRNKEMITEISPALVEAVSWSMPSNTGDGIAMAKVAGADVVHNADLPLDSFRVIQSGADVQRQVLYPTYLLGQIQSLGGILVSPGGERFADELGRSREIVRAAMAEGPFYFLIFDAEMATPSPWLKGETFEAQWEIAVKDGMLGEQAETLAELAEKMDIDAENLLQTVATWNQAVEAGADEVFGRAESLGKIEIAPFYAIRYKPAIVQTLGGLRINPEAQVLDREGSPVPGLFAAGQVTGGVHGADYIGGSALLEVVVFGVIAGKNAARRR